MAEGNWAWVTDERWQSSRTSSNVSSPNKHLEDAIENVAHLPYSSWGSEREESMKYSFSTVAKKRKFQTKPTGKKLVSKVTGTGQMPGERFKTQYGSPSNVKMSSRQINQVAKQVVQQLSASSSHYDSDTDESLCLEKTRTFQTTPMGKKRIFKVGGIGQLSGERLNDIGIRYAQQLFGKFLLIGPENEVAFKQWLAKKTDLAEYFQNECYQSFLGYYQNFFK